MLNNLSLQLNPVSVYQILKIAVTPCLVAIEMTFYGRRPSRSVAACILVLCVGVALATVNDFNVDTLDASALGLVAGLGSAVMSALYQIWSGTKQKELGLSGTQLVHACTPAALGILTLLVPFFDRLGTPGAGYDDGTVLGYAYTAPAVTAILLSAVLGLGVTVTTMVWIGLTSSMTYNVVGHVKTVIIVAGGFALFGDDVTGQKLAGLTFAMSGIVGYSWLKMADAAKPGAR